MPDRKAAIAEYNRHIEEVRTLVPAESLLVFSAEQGWAPLCEFLGVNIPQTEFPNVNDRQQVKKTIAVICWGAYFILAGCTIAVGAIVDGLNALLP